MLEVSFQKIAQEPMGLILYLLKSWGKIQWSFQGALAGHNEHLH